MNSSTRYTSHLFSDIPARNIQGKGDAVHISVQRCSACQLQLCKSRDQPPHAQLQVCEPQPEEGSGGAHKASDTVYTCQVCGTQLVHSPDRTVPGWRKFNG